MSSTDDAMSGPRPDNGHRGARGSVVVARAGGRGRTPSRLAWFAILGAVILVAGAAAVSLSGPLLDRAVVGAPAQPAATLDAAAVPAGAPATTGEASAPAEAEIEGVTRLGLLGPQSLLDTRASAPLGAGTEASVPLPALPAGATAVLVEVSLQDAAGPGAVTVGSGDVTLPVLRLAGPGAQTSATAVVPVPPSATLTVRTEGGGHLVLTLVGAFEPAASATAGRVVPLPATRVVDLAPEVDGNVATVDLATVPALADAAPGAVMLQFSADVGVRGGSVKAGPSPDDLPQEVLWGATSGDDRVRGGFLVVPVSDAGTVTVEYRAGTQIRVDLVGYVTSDAAPESADGLVVPLPAPAALPPVAVAPPDGVDAVVVPEGVGVPAGRVRGVLVGVTAQATAEGGVSVHSAADPPAVAPTVSVSPAGPRSVLTLSGVGGGTVRLTSDTAAELALVPQAYVVSAG
ncbi:MAG: hypothetical protein ACFCVF_10630 [Kineosporiaceae bacterium]